MAVYASRAHCVSVSVSVSGSSMLSSGDTMLRGVQRVLSGVQTAMHLDPQRHS